MADDISAKRREILMKTGAKLFLKKGYDGVALDDIVQKAGGSKSTIYSIFGGKCGLFISSIERLCREFNAPLRDLDYTGLDLRASLEKLGRTLATLIVRPEYLALHRLIIAESRHCPEVGRAWYELGPHETHMLIAELLRTHSPKPRPGSKQIRKSAVFLHDALVSDLQHRLLSGVGSETNPKSINLLVHDTVHLFLLGYGKQS